ncbi:hypothetical protein CkaCkLH20_00408 [Colletotrichum karsti]|uniref:Small ribosomal subunit protein mS35 mitochondrial conserved domain-containing protein n=1 Tax=Colletotrichum karsti TaxID=1095194 RepID=A0A9P6IFE1_9PEZI|nr:uncharacterized protein CkaCkLH20_00408 [Colletotrichum karsti]KAF9882372.1 hypothetical protein CkaCkLH20_00408 [Colletotrichum karsti]
MAAAGQALRLCVRGCRWMPAAPRIAPQAATQFSRHTQRRAFAVSSTRRARDDDDGEGDSDPIYSSNETVADMIQKLKPEETQALEKIRKRDPSAQEMTLEKFLEREMTKDLQTETEPIMTNQEFKVLTHTPRPNRMSFWYDEDDPKADTENVMDEFDEDDMTTMAHGKLDEIREYRHYHRIMAWEMPLLSKLAKPFEPPAKEEVLRFRYTTYMGEYHPAEKKVVVQFSPSDLELTEVQANKLRKLAGPRYNPEKDIIKMSSEKYEEQAQNKRYLSDLVDKLVETAKDPNDTFEDIPLDTRHHQFKRKPKFPVEWRMTPERRQELNAFRASQLQSEYAKEEQGKIVSGEAKIEKFLQAADEAAAEGKVEEMVAVQSRGGKQKAPAGR